MARWKYTRTPNTVMRTATGMSRSEFKTRLRRAGFKVLRDFWGRGCMITLLAGRYYRVRFEDTQCLVDQSCKLADFDRWANSTEQVLEFKEFAQDFL